MVVDNDDLKSIFKQSRSDDKENVLVPTGIVGLSDPAALVTIRCWHTSRIASKVVTELTNDILYAELGQDTDGVGDSR